MLKSFPIQSWATAGWLSSLPSRTPAFPGFSTVSWELGGNSLAWEPGTAPCFVALLACWLPFPAHLLLPLIDCTFAALVTVHLSTQGFSPLGTQEEPWKPKQILAHRRGWLIAVVSGVFLQRGRS